MICKYIAQRGGGFSQETIPLYSIWWNPFVEQSHLAKYSRNKGQQEGSTAETRGALETILPGALPLQAAPREALLPPELSPISSVPDCSSSDTATGSLFCVNSPNVNTGYNELCLTN